MADDKPASILTDAQRDFFESGGETDNAAHDRALRSRIRGRLRAGLDDLRLLLNTEAERKSDEPSEVTKVLADVDAGRVWPLSALLFLWASEHPMFTDRDDLADTLSKPGETSSTHEQMDRITTSFDSQIESGVSAALEFGDHDHVPEDVTNELTVTLGEPVDEMTDEDLAELPRRTLDLLFRRGDLDNQEYARVMGVKLDREDGAEE
jgi:hypothetical protein